MGTFDTLNLYSMESARTAQRRLDLAATLIYIYFSIWFGLKGCVVLQHFLSNNKTVCVCVCNVFLPFMFLSCSLVQIQGPIDHIKRVTVTVSLVTKDLPHRPHPHCLVGKDCPNGSGICVVTLNPHSNRRHRCASHLSPVSIKCILSLLRLLTSYLSCFFITPTDLLPTLNIQNVLTKMCVSPSTLHLQLC